ncbi:hypothetical protein M422DRAFT_242197 [Sphaerobolus stellatus SS14]|nr:hypothetical protein M422DRAFT_242197 [Sphaerobolus stellatus SS14]
MTQVKGIGKDAIDGMRVVALILEDMEVSEEMRQREERMRDVLERIENRCAAVVDEMGLTMGQIVAEMEDKLKEVKAGVGGLQRLIAPVPGSYAEVVSRRGGTAHSQVTQFKALTPRHAALLAKEDAKAKQVLIDALDNSEALHNLSEEELVLKANLAIEAMEVENREGVKVIGAKKLRNGGIVLEMTTRAGADKIKSAKAKEDFTNNFGADIQIKNRNHSVLVEHVPVSFQPDIQVELRKVEDVNRLEDYSLVSARWIKPPQRRTPGQRVAHLIVNAGSAVVANAIIRNGIIIAGKRVYGRKLVQEPR